MSFQSNFAAMHAQAMEITGLSDFGPDDYVEPMKLALSDFDKYNRFSSDGEKMAEAGIVELLVGRLLAHQGFRQYPEYATSEVRRPLIIIGTMRTGTTALLHLLSQLPENQTLPFWLGSTPMPRPARETWESNPWYQRAAFGLEQLALMNPRFIQIHPLRADQPDECRLAIGQSFWSMGLAITANAPNYANWCLRADARYAFQYYKKVLGLVAAGDARRWILKDPSHLWGLDSLLDVFPDACIVFTHREITESMTSMASLMHELLKLSMPSLTQSQCGREQLAHWGKALDKTERVRKQHDPARFFDVHINQLQTDPMGTVESIYQYFNLPLSEQGRIALTRHIASGKRAGEHGANRPKPEDFGFTREDVYDAIGEYHGRSMEMSKLFD